MKFRDWIPYGNGILKPENNRVPPARTAGGRRTEPRTARPGPRGTPAPANGPSPTPRGTPVPANGPSTPRGTPTPRTGPVPGPTRDASPRERPVPGPTRGTPVPQPGVRGVVPPDKYKKRGRRAKLTEHADRSPDRIRTGVTALRGRRPRPLDDGAEHPPGRLTAPPWSGRRACRSLWDCAGGQPSPALYTLPPLGECSQHGPFNPPGPVARPPRPGRRCPPPSCHPEARSCPLVRSERPRPFPLPP